MPIEYVTYTVTCPAPSVFSPRNCRSLCPEQCPKRCPSLVQLFLCVATIVYVSSAIFNLYFACTSNITSAFEAVLSAASICLPIILIVVLVLIICFDIYIAKHCHNKCLFRVVEILTLVSLVTELAFLCYAIYVADVTTKALAVAMLCLVLIASLLVALGIYLMCKFGEVIRIRDYKKPETIDDDHIMVELGYAHNKEQCGCDGTNSSHNSDGSSEYSKSDQRSYNSHNSDDSSEYSKSDQRSYNSHNSDDSSEYSKSDQRSHNSHSSDDSS